MKKKLVWAAALVSAAALFLLCQLYLYRPRPVVRHPEAFTLLCATIGHEEEGRDITQSLDASALAALLQEAQCIRSGEARSGFPIAQVDLYLWCLDGADSIEIVLGPGINKRYDSGSNYPDRIQEPEALQAAILALLRE